MFWLPLDRNKDVSLTRQLYQQIRDKILNGELKGGHQLPSTRRLADELSVSRRIIIDAFEQLHAEGFIHGHTGSGTFVSEGATFEQRNLVSNTSKSKDASVKDKTDTEIINFRSGIPDLDRFPRRTWGDILKKVNLETPPSSFGYHSPEGRLELRNTLSDYLLRTRGARCHPDQIVITSGATQALSLVAKLLISSNDEVIIEDPITHEIQTIFESQGASLHPIPVDENGMNTNMIPFDKKPSFVFVTPSHQFPLGGTLTIQRRITLIEFARKSNCFIVEDDYDSEFRYESPPISSLQGLEPDRTIYIGTFSKILSPALRLGYLILPTNLVKRCRELKWFSDLHTPSLDQLALADFIREGYLERHIFKMKKVYRKKREVLKNNLKNYFKDKVEIIGDSTGLHLIVKFSGINFNDEVLNTIRNNKVMVYPVELHTIEKGYYKDCIILGYGNLNEKQIEDGIFGIYNAIKHLN